MNITLSLSVRVCLSSSSLRDLNNAVVSMVSTGHLICKSSNPFTNPLVTVLSTPITIGVTVIFMFHRFFSFLARYRYYYYNCYFNNCEFFYPSLESECLQVSPSLQDSSHFANLTRLGFEQPQIFPAFSLFS